MDVHAERPPVVWSCLHNNDHSPTADVCWTFISAAQLQHEEDRNPEIFTLGQELEKSAEMKEQDPPPSSPPPHQVWSDRQKAGQSVVRVWETLIFFSSLFQPTSE